MESSQETVDNHVISTVEKSEEKEMPVPPPPPPPIEEANAEVVVVKKSGKKSQRGTKKSARKSDETSASDPDDSDSNSESEDSSADEKAKRRKKRKLAAKRAAIKKRQKAKAKAKKNKSKKYESTSEDQSSSESSDSDENSELEDKKSRRKALRAKAKKKKSKQLDISSDESDSDSSSNSSSSSSSSDTDSEDEKSKRRRAKAKAKAKRKNKKSKVANVVSSSSSSSEGEEALLVPTGPPAPPLPTDDLDTHVEKVSNILADLKLKQSIANTAVSATALDRPVKKNALEYKRVDQVYDMTIHDWKLVESNKEQKDEFDCVFTVRRRLDWEGKYRETAVDIKSKLLRNALQEVFKDCRSISLVEDTPQIDPHTLFHYYDELKAYVKKSLKPKYKKTKKSKEKKRLHQQVLQCRLLLSYIDEDYTATRKALKPMLKAGTITYDLVWALFKPNTIAFTPTYHNKDDPRCFKVDTAYEYESWMTGIKSWYVDGRYLEYDGKSFGLGDHQIAIQAFKGHKKITSLAAYPLKYHKDAEVSELSG
jgi:hypothetical protein